MLAITFNFVDIVMAKDRPMQIIYIVLFIINCIYYAVNYHVLFLPCLKILIKISEKLG